MIDTKKLLEQLHSWDRQVNDSEAPDDTSIQAHQREFVRLALCDVVEILCEQLELMRHLAEPQGPR